MGDPRITFMNALYGSRNRVGKMQDIKIPSHTCKQGNCNVLFLVIDADYQDLDVRAYLFASL